MDWVSTGLLVQCIYTYVHDRLHVFPQTGQVVSGSQAPYCLGQTLQDRCSSPEGQAGTLDLIEFIALCHHFKGILEGGGQG